MLSASSSPFPLLLPLKPRLGFSVGRHSPSPSCVRSRPPRVSAACASAEKTKSACLYATELAASRASLYEVLGIPTGASGQEIKAAYRRLARICHPDVVAIDRKDSSAYEFMKIHAAYSTLSDPEKRADYDLKLSLRHRPAVSYSGISASAAAAMSGFSGYTRRNWETDQCW